MVYFLRLGGGPDAPIKIGYAEKVSVKARAAGISSACRLPAEVLGVMPGGKEREAELHHQFAEFRMGRFERFRPDPSLLSFIRDHARDLAAVGDNPRAKPKPIVATIRGPMVDWIKELSDHMRLKPGDVVEHALVKYAAELGFEKKAPRR